MTIVEEKRQNKDMQIYTLKANRITSVSVPFRILYSATPVNMHENPINFIFIKKRNIFNKNSNPPTTIFNVWSG